MILTDRQIREHLRNGQVQIDPQPADFSYSATSVDLTLGREIQEWITGPGGPPRICPGREGYSLKDVLDKHTKKIDITNGYDLRPQQFILAWTAERVALPSTSQIAARIEGKSSLARIALGIHVCSPTIHPGFNAPLQLEVCNHGTCTVELVPGMRICQLIFEITLGTPDQEYAGQFKTQKPDDPPRRTSVQ